MGTKYYLLSAFNRHKLLVAALLFLITMAANPDDPTVARLTRFEVKQGNEEKVRKVLAESVSHAIAQEGNIMAEAYYEEGKASVLWLIERWAGPEELARFAKSKQARSLEMLLKESLAQPPKVYQVRDLEPLTKQQWRAVAKASDQPITIMLFVDARTGTQQQFTEIYHKAMPAFRGEPGVVTYQLSEIEGDGTQFVTYEKFRSQDAFKFHLDFPPVKPVVEYLETNVKQPPFQNGLHTLLEIAPMTRE